MKWNWEKPNWPDFIWDAALLKKAEKRFLVGSGRFAGVIRHVDASEIEGELLTGRASSPPFEGSLDLLRRGGLDVGRYRTSRCR